MCLLTDIEFARQDSANRMDGVGPSKWWAGDIRIPITLRTAVTASGVQGRSRLSLLSINRVSTAGKIWNETAGSRRICSVFSGGSGGRNRTGDLRIMIPPL